ncbi:MULTISPECIES: Hsp20/alpha crystallin family protein [Streptomyces]|uniref:Hsp20/alpha crystallin family protein n=1 Tax=Streptomyces tirandamycinicus TaxID=2174846 RepID=A0A2S1SM31_9ACTN|nr:MULTISPECIES: Hsp20/alpha crystallin family protein [Streptomyces]AWI27458.1 Hsp20/alpha crystallin family protein [Streptomyces tirandamycinicus]MCY0982723.1 Hsp20/alpha crystallin family protein [Streptomyces tirandamycinicus]NNJ05315.1 Hsp20/alpha crystallin family protein [Streptomyces sp. PKU-MA01144]
MAVLARRQRFPFSDLPDWFEDFPARFSMPGMADLHSMRIEEYTDGGRYVVRAELPGVEVQDLDVTVEDGILTIKAERTEREVDKHRSEIRYGSLTRALALPKSADESDVRAEYTDGMLTVSVGMGEERTEPRHIEIKRAE